MIDIPRVEPYPDDQERDGYLVMVPWDEAFKEELKSSVPGRDRAWDGQSKQWWVAAERAEVLFYLLIQHFDRYELVDEDTGEIQHVDATGTRAVQARFL